MAAGRGDVDTAGILSAVARPAGYLLGVTRGPRSPRLAPPWPRAIRTGPALAAEAGAVTRAAAGLEGFLLLPWVAESDDALTAFLDLGLGRGPLAGRAALGLRTSAYPARRARQVHEAGLGVVAVGDPLLASGHVRGMRLGRRDFVLLAPMRGVPSPAHVRQLASLAPRGGPRLVWPHLRGAGQAAAARAAGVSLAGGPLFGDQEFRQVILEDRPPVAEAASARQRPSGASTGA
jgi:hypothetical protein